MEETMKMLSLALLALLLQGCAGQVNYTPPSQTYSYKNSRTIQAEKDSVWKKTVANLSSSFFVINNIDKDSGLINVSYSGDPSNYVDCGQIDSYVKNARGERRYVFPASAKFKEYETYLNANLLFYRRKMNLEGRINILIQEASATETLATVNSKYVLTRDLYISNPQGQSQSSSESISFNTRGSDTFKQGGTTCTSNGLLEQEILDKIGS